MNLGQQLLTVLEEVRTCTVCASSLPLGPKPLLAASEQSRILLIGQAPGKAAHLAGIPWQDRSGDRLRDWLGLSREEFYDSQKVAFVPSGFCYPGSAKSGDLPPRPECRPLWHPRILPLLGEVRLTVYVGSYALTAYLGDHYANLTAACEDYENLLPARIALPHPSPRNGIWLSQRPWFMSELLPRLRHSVRQALA